MYNVDKPRKHIMLRERNHIQKTTYQMISFTLNVQKKQIHRDRKQVNGCLGLGYGNKDKQHRKTGGGKNVLKLDGD